MKYEVSKELARMTLYQVGIERTLVCWILVEAEDATDARNQAEDIDLYDLEWKEAQYDIFEIEDVLGEITAT